MRMVLSKWLVSWMFASCAAVAVANDNPFQLVAAFPNLLIDDTATALAILPGKSLQAVAAYQHGEIRILPTDRDSRVAPLFLDLRQRMKSEKNYEDGLHGVAFHPDFATRRKVYVSYSQSSPRRTVLSEFTVPAGGTLRADPKSERMLLEYPHLFGNHWGGGIGFGPDGYLYLGIGDGGMRDDPYRLGQNLWSLHGKILRLDVNVRSPGLASHLYTLLPVRSRVD
jgi:glucose/arabinose dehydrogenase